ncbi:MAG: VCBS repeat-containing protein, partial [Saprospiraceae bacterium]
MFAKNNISKSIILLISFLVIMTSCNQSNDTLFQQISPSKTNIHFSNNITETEDFNILNFHYIYNGGGVGVGDFNKDGFQDLVFTGNQVASKLYLNKQNLTFEDITEKSNFKSKGWATGVSIIDINADGWEDIYISLGGFQCDGNCHNQLFIHQGLDENGSPTFVEMANEYGLDDGLYTQQAAFFDYDLDGDLDVYLLHNVIDKRDKNVPSEKRFINEKSIDYLLENNGNGKFINKSDSLGITERGYGLGITINDFNGDNLPDIYVANDFLSDDLLYLNNGFVQEDKQQHLGFSEVSKSKLKHTSYNAMGVDVADVNSDALPDIFVLDMLPEYNERQKTMLGFMNYNKYLLALRQGYSPQYIRNTLQIHNGFLNGELLPFSEVGYMSGVYKTDWSWTPLLADFDNDGDRDLFVTNGYGKDITDLDFINYSSQRSPFGTKEAQEKELYESVKAMKAISMPNYIFENTSESSDIPNFKNQQNNWIKKENSISNGAVYADLDNDGDLDLVVNNIDEKAFVMENTTSKQSNNNYLKVQLKGTKKNPSAIGTKIQIWTNKNVQSFYQSPVRGYLSSVEKIAHFGLGQYQTIDSLKIVWFNGQEQVLKNVAANQLLKVSISNAKNQIVNLQNLSPVIFSKMTNFQFQHQENYHLDFDAQPLLLHQHSRQGPCLASANVDGEVGDELFVGGAKGFPSQIFTQQSNRKYKLIATLDAEYEDTDAAFFDADNDGDLDLYVVSGGTEFQANAAKYQDRIYLNDGKGNFTKSTINNLPNNSGSCVVPMDFDKDGDIDLFIGGRVSPQNYPQIPQSYLLENTNGQFKDITPKALKNIGMVTDAIWSDYNKNGWQDLIIVGEFMPIIIFKNEKGIINYQSSIVNSNGLWNCIAATDFDNDGDDDYILGNLGENARFQASANEPLAIYNKDFDNNGSFDPLVGQYFLNKKGKKDFYPIHTRDDIMKQIVIVKNRYVKYAEFGQVTLTELLKTDLKSNDFLKANELKS